MSNSLVQNPIVISSAMTSGYKASVASSLGTLSTLRIDKIYWENPGTIGDTATIIDPQNLATMFALRCEVANQSQVIDWSARPKLWRDFQVSQISSGTLYIYTI
jgi:tRNA A37 threonylcarbamoyladenosine synthetase subunit TsaC/SUA5/YrdC